MTNENLLAVNLKDAIVDAFRKSGAAQEISEPRPIDEAGDKICFMVYVHDRV